MKRLDRYLLTHHPLVWNMRLHWVLPVLLALHALFFLAGLAEPQRLARLDYQSTSVQPVAALLAVLLGLLVIIGWLIFYLRNNAFKSFYPVRSRHLLAEFFLSLLVLGLASLLPLSHQTGRYQRLSALTKDVDVIREANTASIAHHFIPFENSQFENYNSCDSLRVRDSLGSLTVQSPPSETPPPPDRPYINGPDTMVERSYLHYCAEPPLSYAVPSSLDRYGVDSIAKRWLYGGNRQQVREVLAGYVALAKKYGGSAQFDVDAQVAEVFGTPRFLVRRRSLLQYDESGNMRSTREYITTHSVQDALGAIVRIREGVLSSEELLFYLYWTLGAALLLFTFRITRLRTWFGAGIGIGILLVIFSVFGAVSGGDGTAMLTVFFLIVLASFIFTAVNLSRRTNKAASGFTFLWVVWSLPFLGLAMMYYIRAIVRDSEYYYDAGGNLTYHEPSPFALWVDGHNELIAFLNLALALLLIVVYVVPQARRWQAAPEE